MAVIPLLSVRGLVKHFPVRRGLLQRVVGNVRAVDGVDFDIESSETLALVGESGCGKTTIGRTVMRLDAPTEGSIRFSGRDVAPLPESRLKSYRRHVQIVFQDPYSSLNPRLRVADIVAEPLVVHGIARGRQKRERVAALLEQVGLPPDRMGAYPHAFSGGQRQRIGIARALALSPSLIVADEPLSALDVSVQAQVINLLSDLQRRLGLAFLFISHDLSVVAHLSHRVAVMYLGRIVETAPTAALFARPRHPYTDALLSAIPTADPGRPAAVAGLSGEVPSPLNPPSGCAFHPRCPLARDICRRERPVLRPAAGEPAHAAACHFPQP